MLRTRKKFGKVTAFTPHIKAKHTYFPTLCVKKDTFRALY